jgi:Ala-tRNA(Pro) deacylase
MFQKIKSWLQSESINFKEIHHEPTKTSEESAKARGEDLSTGGKALVLKVGDSYKLFVISAAKKLDSTAIKKYFNVKKLRFATREELLGLTNLEPGSVPPFGKPIINLKLFVDESIVNNAKITFNAGSLADSIVMSTKDYLRLTGATIFNFSK